MAIVHPFRAVRPVPEVAHEVACVPYDVINTAEARVLAGNNDRSFLHIIRPEIDLPVEVDDYNDRVYEKGAQNLAHFVKSEHVVQEDEPSLYLYKLVMDGTSHTGVFGCVSVDEYDQNLILKHENTRAVKEADRTRHILTQNAHAEPVMLTFRSTDTIQSIIEQTMIHEPLYDFESVDGVRHTVWTMGDARALVEAFGAVPKLYVADGHHRCKAASLAAEQIRGSGKTMGNDEFMYFPAVLFPMDEMRILDYNRIIYKVPMGKDAFMKTLTEGYSVQPSDTASPQQKGITCMYIDGAWYELALPPSQRSTVADSLDVARLNEYVLEPILGIQDVRTDKNIDFVGGIRGTAELERLVDEQIADLAFAMYPTSIEELMAVSDAGLLMPPKSTWFEPKLRSGLLVHLFD